METNSPIARESVPLESSPTLDRGLCLCLSGGGFRATLFHLGAIRRLNQLGVLSKLSTITSVSGGSILNGLLASRWARLDLAANGVFTNLEAVIAEPTRDFCSKDLRTAMLVGTRLKPSNWFQLARDKFSVSANFLAEAYQPYFASTLSELPTPGANVPRFVFCSTNFGTGTCWHFHGGPNARMGDFYNGYCDARDVRVSDAVAASSAFPPGFSAYRMQLGPETIFTREDPWGEHRVDSAKRPQRQAASSGPIFLTDGGVYDNLGVEPVWRTYNTLLVSDAGRPFDATTGTKQGIVSRLRRAADISMEQVAAVRKRWLVADLTSGRRKGALWTLNSRLADFPLPDRNGYAVDACKMIQGVRTDLDAFSEAEIACLENHGYSLADAGVRSWASHLCDHLTSPFEWPSQVWSDNQRAGQALSKSGQRRLIRGATRFILRRG